jgi:hypothetical protein
VPKGTAVSNNQQRDKLEALAFENNKLRPENAQLRRALKMSEVERNALAHRLSTLNYDDSGYQAVLNRAVAAEALTSTPPWKGEDSLSSRREFPASTPTAPRPEESND